MGYGREEWGMKGWVVWSMKGWVVWGAQGWVEWGAEGWVEWGMKWWVRFSLLGEWLRDTKAEFKRESQMKRKTRRRTRLK